MASKDILKLWTTQTRTGSRNQALAMAIPHTPVLKKRKLDNGNAELRISRASPSYIELRSRRTTVDKHNSASDHDDLASVSCCSSDGSSEGVNDQRAEFVDLEVNESVEAETSTHYTSKEEEESERELRAESYIVDSTSQKTMTSTAEENSGRRKSSVVVEKMNMPLKLEIEEFFAEAEKKIQKEFNEKYNFDIVKDEPLQGRYQWVRRRP